MTRAIDVTPVLTACARVRRFRSLLDAFAIAPLGLPLLILIFAALVDYRQSIDKPIQPNDAFVAGVLFAEGLLIAGTIVALVVRGRVRRGANGPTLAAAWLIAAPAALLTGIAAVVTFGMGAGDALGSRNNPAATDFALFVYALWSAVLGAYVGSTAVRACMATARIARWRTDAPLLAQTCEYVLGPGSQRAKLRAPGAAALAFAAAGWALAILAVVAFFALGVAEAIGRSNAALASDALPFDDVYSFVWSLSPIGRALAPFATFASLAFVAGTLLERAARLRAPFAPQAQENDPRPPVLVLRSFRAEHLALDRMVEVATVIGQLRAARRRTLEETVVDATANVGPALAIGRPGDALPPLGAARLYVGESGDWQTQVRAWIAQARIVVAMLGGSEGLHWEFRAVREDAALDRLLVVVPPSSRDELAADWVKVGEQLADAPPDDRAAPFLQRRAPWPIAVVRFGTEHALAFTARVRNEAAYASATTLAAACLANPEESERALGTL